MSASMPRTPKLGAPDIEEAWSWVEDLCREALERVDIEMWTDGAISYDTAWLNQKALIAAMVTGAYCPPPRLHVMLSLLLPKYNGRVCCPDKDCVISGCSGNR